MKSKLMLLLCFLGWHKWVSANHLKTKNSPYPLRNCTRCKKLQEGAYDMAYGCTNWMVKLEDLDQDCDKGMWVRCENITLL